MHTTRSAEPPYQIPVHPAPADLALQSNEGARPGAAGVLQAMELRDELLTRYPAAAALTGELARGLGVSPDRVLVTAGADDALLRICLAFVGPTSELLLPAPTFEMLERYARLAGGEVVPVDWCGGGFPTQLVLDALSERTAVVAVVSPNNPTGAVATADDLERVARAASTALVVLDLAYTEFADEDLTPTALSLPNVVLTRTFSKAYGLAGLRVGYAVGPPDVIRRLRGAGNPYPCAGLALELARRALQEGCADHVRVVRAERGRLRSSLLALGVRVEPSQANFVLGRLRDPLWLRDALAGLGIAVRVFPGRRRLEDAVRIACPGGPAALQRLEHALATALSPQAILFELDAVAPTVGRVDSPWSRRLRAGLERLRPHAPLALVSRGSRGEALERLAARGLADTFDVIDAHTCGAGSPPVAVDADRLRTVLSALSVERAWIVGTPRIPRPAREAGLVPIVLDRCTGADRDALLRRGAARVIPTPADLKGLLP